MSNAIVDNSLWSSLNIDTDGMLNVWVGNSNDGTLKFGVEWDPGSDSLFSLEQNLVNWDLSTLEPFNQRNFSSVAYWDVERVLGHFNVGLGVPEDALL